MRATAVLKQDFNGFQAETRFQIHRKLSDGTYICVTESEQYAAIPSEMIGIIQVPGEIHLQCVYCQFVLQIPFASEHLAYPDAWVFHFVEGRQFAFCCDDHDKRYHAGMRLIKGL